MKYLFLSIALSAIFALSGQDYRIQTTIDEFTGDTVTISDWAVLNDPVWRGGNISYLSVAATNGDMVLSLKVVTGDVCSADEGAEFLIKLMDGTIITLTNLQYTISERGGGSRGLRGSNAQGLHLFFSIQPDHLTALASQHIDKVRISTSCGLIDIEPEKKRYREGLQVYFAEVREYLN